ncbi:ADP ribosylation factor, putative [Entamoeba histolytica HM-1:IMSS-B]|nr:ADP ribosylation factor, putative [Entamoeba histolytica HM-1:IMSS-B]EMS12498.1 small GTPase ArfB1, putative [Entamoeba histolytica HM-3:IMSS]ENY65713.1 small GTPase ArfB1, putative [Entamoeba histolytica HM-1:IMSS-A]BAE94751.1 small GTPase ArfB1 [Entamoeba histolytica]GAT93492.1 ADP ribosylation factor putative [Entamoeba histolytica]
MSFLSFLFKKKQMNILICGLDGAGKTALVLKMQGTDPKSMEIKPTIGYLNPSFKYKTYEWLFWDVSGAAKFRGLWKSYYPNVKCIAYVFDNTDNDRFDESKTALLNMLADNDLKGMPFIIYVNKIDLKPYEPSFADKLALTELQKSRCQIFPCSAYTGEGLMDGLDWMCYTLKKLMKHDNNKK